MKLPITLLAALGLSVTSQASTVTLSTLGFGSDTTLLTNTAVSADVIGTGAIGFGTTAAGSATRTSTYTITGFDFDGNGLNDTLVFDLFQIDSVLGRNISHDSTDGLGISGSSSEGINNSETLQISFQNAMVTLAGTTDTATASLINFTGSTTVTSGGSTEVAIDGVGQGAPGIDTFTSSSPAFSRAISSGSFRVRDVNLAISVDVASVPEPSSTALLGLGGLALIMRRRK